MLIFLIPFVSDEVCYKLGLLQSDLHTTKKLGHMKRSDLHLIFVIVIIRGVLLLCGISLGHIE